MLNRISGLVALIGFGTLFLAGCAGDPRQSKEYKALKRSRTEVMAAAATVRNSSRSNAQPSEKYFGSYYSCAGKDRVHYHLETDWILLQGDNKEISTFNYIISVLQGGGWVSSGSAASGRERTLRRGDLEMSVSVKLGAAWITGEMGGPCYHVGGAASDFIDKDVDYFGK